MSTATSVTVSSVVVTAVAVGATVAAVPAAILGPVAITYEPVRKLCGKKGGLKTNPVAKAATMPAKGVAVFGIGLLAVCGYDSD